MKDKLSIFNALFFILVVFVYFWVFLIIPTDNNGDPNEYISIGKDISFNNILPRDTSSLRSIGYPIFLKITSSNFSNINLVFFFQVVIFLTALYFFTKEYIPDPRFRWIAFIPVLIPAFAYTQKLLFPDGLLISCLLFYAVFMKRNKYTQALILSLFIILIKLVFVLLIPITLLFLFSKSVAKRKFWILCLTPFVAAISITLYIHLFTSMIFMNTFWRPIYWGITDFIPDTSIKVNTEKFHGSLSLLNLKNNIVIHDLASAKYYSPLSKEFCDETKCKNEDIRNIQLQAVEAVFFSDPALHLSLYIKHIFMSMTGNYVTGHLSYMIHVKELLYNEAINNQSFYEARQITNFSNENLTPPTLPVFFIYKLNTFGIVFEKFFRYIVLTTLIILSSLFLINKRKRTLFVESKDLKFIFTFILLYSITLSITVYSLYDRYTYINLFFITSAAAVMLSLFFKGPMIEKK